MAVEIGLHCTPEPNDHSDVGNDQRNRVFWTIYAIEISLAYNLGRPSSIGEDHIASALPKPTSENLSSLHHVRHRQIQSRIVAQVYGINSSTRNMSVEKKQMLISNLQKELDEWQVNIPVNSQFDATYPYRFVILTSPGSSCLLTQPKLLESSLSWHNFCPAPTKSALPTSLCPVFREVHQICWELYRRGP